MLKFTECLVIQIYNPCLEDHSVPVTHLKSPLSTIKDYFPRVTDMEHSASAGIYSKACLQMNKWELQYTSLCSCFCLN